MTAIEGRGFPVKLFNDNKKDSVRKENLAHEEKRGIFVRSEECVCVEWHDEPLIIPDMIFVCLSCNDCFTTSQR